MKYDICEEVVLGHFDQSSYKLYNIPVQQLQYIQTVCELKGLRTEPPVTQG